MGDAPASSSARAGSRSGLVAVAAMTITAFGVYLWIAMLAAPVGMVTGLLDARRLLDAAERHLSKTDFKKAGYEVLAAQAAVDRARAGLDSNSPLLDLVSGIGWVDRALGEVPHLIEAADLSAQAAVGTQQVAQTALRGPNKIIDRAHQQSFIRLDRVAELAGTINEVKDKIDASAAELASVDQSNLPRRARPAIQRGIAKAEKTGALLADAVAGFEILPGVLGAERKRTYLLAMKNPAELRGSGGSILRFALLSIDEGVPKLDNAQSIYRIDVGRKTYDIPLPEDAWYQGGVEDSRRPGNANWSPDWPRSAELTLEYIRASDEDKPNLTIPSIDGVLTLDPLVMENLMAGVGPIETNTGRRITERKVVKFLLYEAYAAYPNTGIRRAVLKQIVENFYKNLVRPNRPTELVEGFGDSLAGRHMQIWLRDDAEQRYMERMNWDGGLEDDKGGDYFSVVEQNVGGNKLNYFETQEHSLDVSLQDGDSHVTATVGVHNKVFAPQPRYVLGDSGDDGDGFFHRPMLNVYVPERAVLGTAEVLEGELLAAPPPAVWSGSTPATHLELGKRVWSGTLQIHAQERGSLRYDYVVPDVLTTRSGRTVYRLTVQHQPKINPETLTVRLSLPEGATQIEAPGWKRENGTLVWERVVDADKVLEVSWQE